MTTRLRYAWIPIVTASALAPDRVRGEDDTGGRTPPTQGTYAPALAQPAQPNEQGNTFEDEGVSGYVDAASDPLSTFALDVDNGSYRIAQAYVAQGTRPPSESVRAEEGSTPSRTATRRRPRPTSPSAPSRASGPTRTARSWSGWPSPRARSQPRSGRRST